MKEGEGNLPITPEKTAEKKKEADMAAEITGPEEGEMIPCEKNNCRVCGIIRILLMNRFFRKEGLNYG